MAAPRKSTNKFGKVIMILQQDFQGYDSRKEEDIKQDVANIRKCFEKLDFDVEDPHVNQKEMAVKDYLTRVYDSGELSQYQCLLVFIVTHSPESGKLLFKDATLCDEELIGMLKGDKRPELAKLLKLFVFQASEALGGKDDDMYDASPFGYEKLPDEANFFVIKSSYERQSTPPEEGSYFLKVFCQIMENIGSGTSLFDAMTCVLGELKANRTIDPEHPRNNFLPEVSSTLLQPLYFRSESRTPLIPTCYEDKQNIGRMIVFNYSYNSKKSKFPKKNERPGNDADVKSIEESFEKIGFKVEDNKNLKADDFRSTLNEGSMCRDSSCSSSCSLRHPGDAAVDYSNDTCVSVAIMSHGGSDRIETIDYSMDITEIISGLITMKEDNTEKEDLSGKPKLFFVQTCRESDAKGIPVTPPLEYDDTLMFYSSYQGKKSARTAEGTWFVQSICEEIDRIPSGKSVAFTDILQNVQRSVAERFSTQMPVVYSTLTKILVVQNL